MKNLWMIVAAVAETVLLVATALVFMFWRPFHVTIVLSRMETSMRVFDVDWLLGVLIVATAIALIGALAKRFKSFARPLGIALALTLLYCFAKKFGFRTSDIRMY